MARVSLSLFSLLLLALVGRSCSLVLSVRACHASHTSHGNLMNMLTTRTDSIAVFESNGRDKILPLASLVVQNSAMLILMRYSMLHTQQKYLASTAVMFSEAIKLTISILAVFFIDASGSFERFKDLLWRKDREEKLATFAALTLPAILYTIQNNLQYLAIANLSPALFQVLYQMKVVTAALFSVIILGRRLRLRQWFAIMLLTVGLAVTQLSQQGAALAAMSIRYSAVGLAAVIAAATTSGLAGVCVEKLIKNGVGSGPTAGSGSQLWSRNVQMSSIAIVFALISCLIKDSAAIMSHGWIMGYSPLVWGVIALQAVGGLIVSLVMKRADNLLKGFATSVSIILSSVFSAVLFADIKLTKTFAFGALMVIGSTMWYSWTPPHPVSAPRSHP